MKMSKSKSNTPNTGELSPEVKKSAAESEKKYWELRKELEEKYGRASQLSVAVVSKAIRSKVS
jgi:hypothetical protein